MEIRTAREEDLTGIASIYVAGHRVAYQAAEDKPYLEKMRAEVEKESFEPELDYERGYFVVGVEEGRLLGFAYGGIADQPNTAGFSELWVDPEHHGGATSKLLMKAFVEEMISRGAVRMVGYVAEHNGRATTFMRKTKARKVDRRDMRIFNNVADLPERRVAFAGWQWDELPALVVRLNEMVGGANA